MKLPAALSIPVLDHQPHATVRVPGSKSITNRALALAAASAGPSVLTGVLRSEDTEVMVACLQRLGIGVECDWSAERLRVHPGAVAESGIIELFVGNSGTTMRFLTALVAARRGRFRLDGVPRMRARPIQDLLDALAQLGADARSEGNNGCPPVIVHAAGLRGGTVRIKADVSSQFLSGLLLAAPLAQGDVTIDVEGPLVSQPYVEMTVRMMADFGVRVHRRGGVDDHPVTYHVPGNQCYRGRTYAIEPDASAASYFFASAAITGGSITVPGLAVESLQGDVRFVDALERMGCRVERGADAIAVTGGPLHGIDADMNAISDTVMTLAAVACFAHGSTTIRNVAHIRHKESDRLAALAAELRRVGAAIEERSDGLVIHPHPLHGAEIETYDDHRMAMSMSLIGLRVPGMIIKDPDCVGKTYPAFFEELFSLGGNPSCR